jgi:ribosomal protein S18 acetylase RimI-like enzyme
MTVEIVTYKGEHFDGMRSLWQEAFPGDTPWNSAANAIPAKLAFQPNLLVVALDAGRVVGSILAGYDGNRGWLYSVAVLNSHRRQHVGTALVREAEARLESLGCSKINLQIRSTNAPVAAFYQRLGYSLEERISMGKRIDRSCFNEKCWRRRRS